MYIYFIYLNQYFQGSWVWRIVSWGRSVCQTSVPLPVSRNHDQMDETEGRGARRRRKDATVILSKAMLWLIIYLELRWVCIELTRDLTHLQCRLRTYCHNKHQTLGYINRIDIPYRQQLQIVFHSVVGRYELYLMTKIGWAMLVHSRKWSNCKRLVVLEDGR